MYFFSQSEKPVPSKGANGINKHAIKPGTRGCVNALDYLTGETTISILEGSQNLIWGGLNIRTYYNPTTTPLLIGRAAAAIC